MSRKFNELPSECTLHSQLPYLYCVLARQLGNGWPSRVLVVTYVSNSSPLISSHACDQRSSTSLLKRLSPSVQWVLRRYVLIKRGQAGCFENGPLSGTGRCRIHFVSANRSLTKASANVTTLQKGTPASYVSPPS